jgi:hypothetical protein
LDAAVNPVPVTVSDIVPEPAAAVLGEMEVIVGTGFAVMVNVIAFEVPPPVGGL